MLDLRFRPMTRDNRVAKPGYVFKPDPFNVAWSRQLNELEHEIDAIKGRDTVVEACMLTARLNEPEPKWRGTPWRSKDDAADEGGC